RVAGVKPGDLGGALVLDVDQSDAYARGHVPGAAWLCRSRLELRIGGIAPDTRAPTVLTCRDGTAPTPAAPAPRRPRSGTVRVVDGSWHMLQLGRDARGEFAQAHIPGAVFFDIDEIADTSSPLPHMLPTARTFARRVGALGIGTRDLVVVYDTRGVVSAARVWWTFRAFRHERVAVLDGGFPKWRAEGRPVQSGFAAPTPRRFAARLHRPPPRALQRS